MKGALSYSLFGFDRSRAENSFDFQSYLRGLHLCIRFNRLIYPGWTNVLNIDNASYNSPYKPIFDWHENQGNLTINVFEDGKPLCLAMLQRLRAVFMMDGSNWKFTHVLCRDLDSISTYREAQMVQEWIEEDKAIHCITDSISHTIPMMGGMIGFRPGYVNDILKITDNPSDAFDRLIERGQGIDYRHKGTDQDFLNRVIYPSCSTHATEHFIKGMSHNLIEGNGRHYSVTYNRPKWIFDTNWTNEICSSLEADINETNLLVGHVGAAGYYETPTMRFLYHKDPFKESYQELEMMKGFEKIFYWSTREDLR